MGLSSDFFKLFKRRPRRPTADQLKLLREAIVNANYLVYYLLGDTDETESLAFRALTGLMNDFDVLKHRISNQGSYRQSVVRQKQSQSRVRKVPLLPFELELAVRVFTLTTAYQWKNRPHATREDFDVWFCKSVMLESLRHKNAFSALFGISNWIHSYTERELVSLFDALSMAVPRIQEPWNDGNEPIRSNRNRLAKAIAEEFGNEIKTDSKGNPIRRARTEQPSELVAECILTLTLQEAGAPCLKEVVKPDHSRGFDLDSELRRIHKVLHWPCYTGLAGDAGLPHPKEKTGMPEYTTMSKTNGNRNRIAPQLSEEESDEMVEKFLSSLEQRRTAPTKVFITIDGEERKIESIQLDESGHVSFPLNESTKLVEVWAREEAKADVLLTGFFLSLADERRTVTLEAGQKISFGAEYVETGEGNGSFELDIGYRETRITRKLQQIYRRKAERTRQTFSSWRAQPALRAISALVGVGSLIGFFGIGLLYTLITAREEMGSRSIPATLPPESKESQALTGIRRSTPGMREADSGATPDGNGSSDTPEKASPEAGYGSRDHVRDHVNEPRGKVRQVPSLATIKEIYVENVGIYDNPGLNSQAYLAQVEALRKSGMFQSKLNPEEADARLVIVSDFQSGSGDKAQMQLVTTKERKVIWYGPLLDIARNSSPETGPGEIVTLVRQSTEALITKKENAMTNRAPLPRRRGRRHH